MKQKLHDLREELAKGNRHLELLDQQRQQLRDTILRISGAIQVLEELLQAEPSPNAKDNAAESESRGALARSEARISH